MSIALMVKVDRIEKTVAEHATKLQKVLASDGEKVIAVAKADFDALVARVHALEEHAKAVASRLKLTI